MRVWENPYSGIFLQSVCLNDKDWLFRITLESVDFYWNPIL